MLNILYSHDSTYAALFVAACSVIIWLAWRCYGWYMLRQPLPMIVGDVPWLGAALTFAKSPLEFFDRAIRDLGPTFAAKIAGRKMIFVTNPLDFAPIWRDVRMWSFDPVVEDVCVSVFGLTREEIIATNIPVVRVPTFPV